MAWSGLAAGIEWGLCLAILAWAVLHLVLRFRNDFAPAGRKTQGTPECGGCSRCDSVDELKDRLEQLREY